VINGGTAGRLRVAASGTAPAEVPDWLVVGLELLLIPASDDDPGNTPDQTSLFQEGCGDVSPLRLLESWSRHTLVWLNTVANDGNQALHAEWRGLAHNIGKEVTVTVDGTPATGIFVGIDEDFGMLLRQDGDTRLIPLTTLLENKAPS
jgi:biotin-(acetyl-CoA carboxylase) ligase